LVFESDDKIFKKNFKHWQFVTFILDEIWGRAYSILDFLEDNKFILIIKKWEEKDGGRWGSKYICKRELWDVLKWVWPSGHFLLQENSKNKLFLATWTGLVPLYNQIVGSLEKNNIEKIMLIFWVRKKEDLFYLEKLENLKKQNKNFDYKIYLSREESEYEKWYITDFLDKNNIKNFEEFYICWTPNMIDSSAEKLTKLWIKRENIYFEKY
jgi:NAD(P)H-flavin reductase